MEIQTQTLADIHSPVEQSIEANRNGNRRGRKPNEWKLLDGVGSAADGLHIQTFHFHFSEEMTEQFAYFAKLHQFDDRIAFKENWQSWIRGADVADCISRETERLMEEGYTGNILNKMFKSVRYYYRKKPANTPEPKKRKEYESLSQEVLRQMDEHILGQISENTDQETKVYSLSPAKAYENYCIYRTQTKEAEIPDKVKYKKTYKNRFFLLSKKIQTAK